MAGPAEHREQSSELRSRRSVSRDVCTSKTDWRRDRAAPSWRSRRVARRRRLVPGFAPRRGPSCSRQLRRWARRKMLRSSRSPRRRSPRARRWRRALDPAWRSASRRSARCWRRRCGRRRRTTTRCTDASRAMARVGQADLAAAGRPPPRAPPPGAQLTDCPSLIYYYGGRAQLITRQRQPERTWSASSSARPRRARGARPAAAADARQAQAASRARDSSSSRARRATSWPTRASIPRGAWPPSSLSRRSGKAALEQWLRQQQGGGAGAAAGARRHGDAVDHAAELER